jgi:NAD(P)-dependent dehydrogenase (short-subunit alcohol dehydrogenase family)
MVLIDSVEGRESMRFEGKSAIVTGGARGIGRAIVTRLASEGAKVLIADIDEAAAATAAREIAGTVAYKLDVTSNDSWQGAVQKAVADWGKIDILVNNAGIAGRSAPAWELEIQEWLDVINIDLTGVWLGCRAVLPGMIEKGYGRIVNIASIAGKEGNPNASPYSAAKSGVIGLTKSLAKEVATKGVIINGITPAVIETDILKQISEEHKNYMTSRIPMGRVGQPEEVAALAAFLASSEVTFSTGAIFDLSGGRATY